MNKPIAVTDIIAKIERITTTVDAFRTAQVARIDNIEKAVGDLLGHRAAQRIGIGGPEAGDASTEALAAYDAYIRHGIQPQGGLITISDPDGGYTIPERRDNTIAKRLVQRNVIRQLAQFVNLEQGDTLVRFQNHGAAAAGWVGETEARPETTTPRIVQLEYRLREIYANPASSQRLLDDSGIDVAEWLAGEIVDTFAQMEADAFIRGDGIKRPRGFTQYDMSSADDATRAWNAVQYIASGSTSALGTSDNASVDNLITMQHKLHAGHRASAVWVMNSTTASVIRKLRDGEGRHIWAASIQQGMPATLLGMPVEIDDAMDDVGSGNYPIALADWQAFYLVLGRGGVNILRDEYTNKPYVMFYTRMRSGGGVFNFRAGKLLRCATS